MHLRNTPEFVLSWFGLAALGAVLVPSNIANTEPELGFIASKARVVE